MDSKEIRCCANFFEAEQSYFHQAEKWHCWSRYAGFELTASEPSEGTAALEAS